MKVVISAASFNEIKIVKDELEGRYTSNNGRIELIFKITGVGMLATTYSVLKLIYDEKPDLVIEIGIAGCFDKTRELTEVVVVQDEYIGDIGVEENGLFKDVFDMGFDRADEFPFAQKKLTNPHLQKYNLLQLEAATAITISEISTQQKRIEQLKQKYDPLIESMEGAACHYVCLQTNTRFIQIRCTSNYVGERDKSKWQFKNAFDNLANTTINYVDKLSALL